MRTHRSQLSVLQLLWLLRRQLLMLLLPHVIAPVLVRVLILLVLPAILELRVQQRLLRLRLVLVPVLL